jgi:hypothetical protein
MTYSKIFHLLIQQYSATALTLSLRPSTHIYKSLRSPLPSLNRLSVITSLLFPSWLLSLLCQSIRKKSNWAAIPNSATLIDSLPFVTLISSKENQDPSASPRNQSSIKVNLYDIRSLDYGLEDVQVFRYAKGRQAERKATNSFPPKISFSDPRHERDSLLWVAYASQHRKVFPILCLSVLFTSVLSCPMTIEASLS